MNANQAQGIIEYMPTLVERQSLRNYMKAPPVPKNKDGGSSSSCNTTAAKSFERLCECEKFMVAMMTVKQSKRKIRALLFKLQFRGCIHDLAHGECLQQPRDVRKEGEIMGFQKWLEGFGAWRLGLMPLPILGLRTAWSDCWI